eukprot:SM000038S14351  [mRNA]  locus=s38:407647:411817:+ [translate_table: standard]
MEAPVFRPTLEEMRALTLEHFWKNVTHAPPLYGADGVGSLFDEDVQGWNPATLATLLSRTLEEAGISIPGVTTSYLYFGMWRSMFAWHTEDVDLYSVNYLHFGESKSWYTIPPAHRLRFERVVQGLLPDLHKECHQFLRHKETLVTPQLLQQYNIPVIKVVQEPGQFVINLPGVYHAGFNHGYNCAESTNFATKRWLEMGAKAKACTCSRDSVKIDMALFGIKPAPGRAPRSVADGVLHLQSPAEHIVSPRSHDHSVMTAINGRDRPTQKRPKFVKSTIGLTGKNLGSTSTDALKESMSWVQCEACDKWRELPLTEMGLDLHLRPTFMCDMLPVTSCTTAETSYEEDIQWVYDSVYDDTSQVIEPRRKKKKARQPVGKRRTEELQRAWHPSGSYVQQPKQSTNSSFNTGADDESACTTSGQLHRTRGVRRSWAYLMEKDEEDDELADSEEEMLTFQRSVVRSASRRRERRKRPDRLKRPLQEVRKVTEVGAGLAYEGRGSHVSVSPQHLGMVIALPAVRADDDCIVDSSPTEAWMQDGQKVPASDGAESPSLAGSSRVGSELFSHTVESTLPSGRRQLGQSFGGLGWEPVPDNGPWSSATCSGFALDADEVVSGNCLSVAERILV